jgi:hypothetical protein
MRKVDVAVQSYRKPESLIYTLMTLYEYSRDRIDTVFINDDCSNDGTVDYYLDERIQKYFRQWRLLLRVNSRPVRWPVAFVLGFRPRYMSLRYFVKWGYRNVKSGRRLFYDRDDIRYQWALDSTDKPCLFLVHDDIEFRNDVIGAYLDSIESLKRPAIVGDLGQCWRCGHSVGEDPCSPERIMKAWRPADDWPLTKPGTGGHGRECRINEWSALVSVAAAMDILAKERCFFGNYDDYGDVGAYWFERALHLGYEFNDPFPAQKVRDKWYKHMWQGKSGHSVWATQDNARNTYDRSLVLERMRERYGIEWRIAPA